MNIGLALGSGSSRGWSHIGVIHALAELGIVPNIICGTSIGSLVGASYLANNLEKLEEWACSLTKFEMVRFFNISSSLNGFINTTRLHDFLNEYVAGDDAIIGDFSSQYAAIATDLETGREVWLAKGSVIEAVWASMSLPGLFPAIKNNNKWLVDGGLVNPVPVSACRALGADIVIAVNLNGDIIGRAFKRPKERIKLDVAKAGKVADDTEGAAKSTDDVGVVGKVTDLVREYTASVFTTSKVDEQPPGLFEAIAGSVNIIQDRITRSRMAGDPPDILLSPKLSHIGLLEFYRATEAISEGELCVQRMLPEIKHILGMD